MTYEQYKRAKQIEDDLTEIQHELNYLNISKIKHTPHMLLENTKGGIDFVLPIDPAMAQFLVDQYKNQLLAKKHRLITEFGRL